MSFRLYERKFMIYELHMRKRSKNADDLESRYPMSKELLEKKLRRLYRVRLRHLKVLLLLQPSQSFQSLNRLYDVSFAAVVVELQDIK
jgi:transcription initiation factor IIE alpha subunit